MVSISRSMTELADWLAAQEHTEADTGAHAHAFIVDILAEFIKHLNISVSPFVFFDVATLPVQSVNVKPPNVFLDICTYLPMAYTCFYGFYTIMGLFIRIRALYARIYRVLIVCKSIFLRRLCKSVLGFQHTLLRLYNYNGRKTLRCPF